MYTPCGPHLLIHPCRLPQLLTPSCANTLLIDFHRLSLFSSLHCASFFGIIEIIAGLVEAEGCAINKIDCIGSAPLMWAALNGHERAVIILLGHGADPDRQDSTVRTPLWCATSDGHEGVVKILLGRDDVGPEKLGGFGQTPPPPGRPPPMGTREW